MPLRVYTKDQLLALRNSPLVCKPENLPAIEAWIEYVSVEIDGERQRLRIPHSESQQQQQQQSQAQRPDGTPARRGQQRPATGGEASPMGNFSAGSRPSLMQTRSHVSRSGEDISLGPPKALFPSSRIIPRLSDFSDKTNDANQAEDVEAPRPARGFGDKQANRKSLNANENESRHSKESWMQARERRAQGGDEEGGEHKLSRREREQEYDRKNGFGDKTDSRWGSHREDKRSNGDRTGGWRERERERQKHDRDRDRDWDRSGKEPEWMADPVAKQDDDLGTMGMPKNQEDFEKWKQAQHARNKKSTDETVIEVPKPPLSAPPQSVAAPVRKIEPLKLDSLADKAFGGWGETRRPEPINDITPSTVQAAVPTKGKSRFMPMFQKDKPKEQDPIMDIVQAVPTGSEDDNKAGFDRILQMLSTTGASQATAPANLSSGLASRPVEPISPPPQTRITSQVQRPKSRFTGFFDQTPKSPDRMQSPRMNDSSIAFAQVTSEGHGEERNHRQELKNNSAGGPLDEYTHQRPNVNSVRPQTVSNAAVPVGDRQEHQPQQNRMHGLFLDAPARTASTPDNNIQNLLAQRNKGQQGQDKNSDFLLSLLQTKGTPRPASSQAHPNFALWIDQSKNNVTESHAEEPVAHPKPGSFEGQDPIIRHAPSGISRQDQHQDANQITPQPRATQRAPPGFFDEQTLFLQQQQQHQQLQGQAQHRTFPEPHQQQMLPPGRRIGGHPGQQMQMAPSAPPQYLVQDYAQSTPGAHPGPPPGFNPHIRHPPGFHNIPNIFEAPHSQQQKQRQPVPPPTTGFGGNTMMPGQGQQLPNVPPGFFNGPQQAMPSGFMMRQSVDGLPAGVRGNGRGSHDIFDETYDHLRGLRTGHALSDGLWILQRFDGLSRVLVPLRRPMVVLAANFDSEALEWRTCVRCARSQLDTSDKENGKDNVVLGSNFHVPNETHTSRQLCLRLFSCNG
nr:hypothetical protein CFP56_26062 [Quercus suber]